MSMPDTMEAMLLQVIRTVKEHRLEELQRILDELQPYDMAELFRAMPAKHRAKFLSMLTNEQLALLIQELEDEDQLSILQTIGPERASEILNLMENDDLADLLSALSTEQSASLLSAMQKEESETVRNLMQYPPQTAGGIMTNRYVWIKDHFTVREAVEKVKAFAEYAENIYYLYVLDDQKKLVGVVSYRDLVLADSGDKIKDIMYNRVISVPVLMDQEEVARTIERYDFIALPVVDEEKRLVGIVTVDDIIDVIVEEANEDIQKLSASGGAIDFRTRALEAAMRRLPWLILLLFLGIISGSVISIFETTLDQVVALAFFMPMIAGMTGNTGTQSLAIVVRGLVSQTIDSATIWRLVSREFKVGLTVGLVCGVLIAIITYFWQGNAALSMVIGASLLLTLIIGTMAGTIIPIILYRLRIDPAIASGPLITTLNDIFSLLVYFGLATVFLSHILLR